MLQILLSVAASVLALDILIMIPLLRLQNQTFEFYFCFFVFLMQMSKQMDSFRSNLEEFAGQHREEIRRNPQFRSQFQEMCAAIGVDPLACKSSRFTMIVLT